MSSALLDIITNRTVGLFLEPRDEVSGLMLDANLSDDEVDAAITAACRLCIPGDGVLWAPDILPNMMAEDLQGRAKFEAEEVAQSDAVSPNRNVVRGPTLMMLELAWYSRDGGDWLWKPCGPPVPADGIKKDKCGSLCPDAKKCQMEADAAADAEVFAHSESGKKSQVVCSERWNESLAKRNVLDSQSEMAGSIEWATQVWEYTIALRGLAFARMWQAREAACMRYLITSETVEEAGLSAATASSRIDCLLAIWDVLCPMTLDLEGLRRMPELRCSAPEFWAAAVEAARLEMYRAGGGEKAVLAALADRC